MPIENITAYNAIESFFMEGVDWFFKLLEFIIHPFDTALLKFYEKFHADMTPLAYD